MRRADRPRVLASPLVPGALLAGALAVPGLASAFTLYGWSWAWQRYPVEAPVGLATGSFPAALGTEDQIEDAFVAALDTWNTTGEADVWLAYGGRIPEASARDDGEFTVGWVDGADPYNPEAVAVALAWFQLGAAPGAAEPQTDCDIRFYARNGDGPIGWNVGGAPAFIDLQEIATHELGHCLGLDHSEVRDAMMWPEVHNDRTLHPDDQAGLQALYGPGCADADGDGFTCDDCADGDPDRHPFATEVCNGVDDDCDGVIDADDRLEATFGGSTQIFAGSDAALAGIFRADADRVLDGFGQEVHFDADTRVYFGVYESSALEQPFELVRSDVVEAGPSSGVVDSPPLDVALAEGRYYLLVAVAQGRADYPYAPLDGAAQADLTPVGSTRAYRPPAERIGPPEVDATAPRQVLRLEAPDQDGDGATTLCGDCDDTDPTRSPAAVEACDGVDEDCDGVVDQGFSPDECETAGLVPGGETGAGSAEGCGCTPSAAPGLQGTWPALLLGALLRSRRAKGG